MFHNELDSYGGTTDGVPSYGKAMVMAGTIYRLTCAAALILTSGCAMCSNCDDDAYSAFVGRWERLDPCYGRVGSAFTPEVGQLVDDVVEGDPGAAEEITTPEPTPAEKQEETPPPAEERPLGDAPAAPETSILQPPLRLQR
jgi:hypothetical protein